MFRTIATVTLSLTLLSAAHGQVSDVSYCRQIGARSNSVDERECLLLLRQTRSNNDWMSKMAQAKLLDLQLRIFNRLRREEEESTDFSRYGTPAPQNPALVRHPGIVCDTLADPDGAGGVTFCD